jgi:aspartate/methionine/tyrosine aminotransferase
MAQGSAETSFPGQRPSACVLRFRDRGGAFQQAKALSQKSMTLPSFNPAIIDTGTPPIPEATAWAERYDGRQGPLINLSQAAPGGAPHPLILETLRQAAGEPETARYGAILGDADLRETYADWQARFYGTAFSPDEIAITAGCNMAFFATLLCIAGPGTSVLVPTPWYFNHAMAATMLGIEARALPCSAEAGFVPDPDQAERLIDTSTRAIVLVTPNNPTGAIYPPETIAAFHALCQRKGLFLILDETYRDFLPQAVPSHKQRRSKPIETGSAPRRDIVPHQSFHDPAWRETVLGLYSFSKSFAIPGYRLGAITAGTHMMREIGKALDTIQICPSRTGQRALVTTIPALQPWRVEKSNEINAKATAFRQALSPNSGWIIDSIGAYFAYLRHPFAGRTARNVAEWLATEYGLLVLPGSWFGDGQDSHMRIAIANIEHDAVQTAAERLHMAASGKKTSSFLTV